MVWTGRQKAGLALGGLVIYGGGMWAGWKYRQVMKAPRNSSIEAELKLPSEAHRILTFDYIADGFDDDLRLSEFFSGISLMRWWMLRKAKGKVLEVAIGTGRNLQYYNDDKVTSVTGFDVSKGMVQVAKEKINNLPEGNVKRSLYVEAGDGADRDFLMNLAVHNGGKFDTIVDTFGICSFEDPVQVLRNLSSVLAPDGRILLLEHGRSDWDWYSQTILDSSVCEHARKWGCYWNRDICQIVNDAGLTIENCTRFHLGTTYMIYAKINE